jgi:cephalosporin hydroxylase
MNFTGYDTDKNTTHSYGMFYDIILSPFKDKEVNIFECGYYTGGSAHLFADYLPHANIRSIDINEAPEPTNPRIRFDIISIKDLTPDYFNDFPVDIAIDDGSHKLEDQLQFVKLLYPAMRSGGIIVLEDIQDIEHTKAFNEWPIEVVDLRYKKFRYDDIILVIKKP